MLKKTIDFKQFKYCILDSSSYKSGAKKMIKITEYYELPLEEIRRIIDEHRKMEEELTDLRRKKEVLLSEWHINNSNIFEYKKRSEELEKKLKLQKRKSKNKYRKMKADLMSEIIYLKSKLYENNNIYPVKREKTQNIVKLYK